MDAGGLARDRVLLPFYGAIRWALIIALLLAPAYRWLLPRLKGRRNATAGLVMQLGLLAGVLPCARMTSSLAREASVVYQCIDSGDWCPALYLRGLFDALPVWVTVLLERAGFADFDNLQRPILVGKNACVPDYVVMISTLGGMAVFGINGFITGPTIAAVFIAVWHMSITATPREK